MTALISKGTIYMTGTTLPRALRITLNLLAWASLPMLGLTIASAFTFPVRGDIAISAGMMVCAMCALSRVVQLHQDARLQRVTDADDARIRAITEADDAQQRALIRALAAKGGPATGPSRILRVS